MSDTRGFPPASTVAIGFSAWDIQVPSGRYIFNGPKFCSSLTPRCGFHPHNSAARGLNSWTTPNASQKYVAIGPRSNNARNRSSLRRNVSSDFFRAVMSLKTTATFRSFGSPTATAYISNQRPPTAFASLIMRFASPVSATLSRNSNQCASSTGMTSSTRRPVTSHNPVCFSKVGFTSRKR